MISIPSFRECNDLGPGKRVLEEETKTTEKRVKTNDDPTVDPEMQRWKEENQNHPMMHCCMEPDEDDLLYIQQSEEEYERMEQEEETETERILNFVGELLPDLTEAEKEMNHLFSHASVAEYVCNEVLAGKYVYCDRQSCWYMHEKCIWRVCEEPVDLMKTIRDSVFSIIKKRRDQYDGLKEKTINTYGKDPRGWPESLNTIVEKCKEDVEQWKTAEKDIGNHAFLNSTVKCVKMFIRQPNFAQKLDSNPNIIACTDQVCNLVTGEWEPLRADHYVSKTTGYPRPEPCPVIQEKIEVTLRKMQRKEEDSEHIIKVAALSLSGRNTRQKIYFTCGSGGNGKTVLFTLLGSSLGDYFIMMDVASITKDKKGQNEHSDWCRTIGCRIVIFEEPNENDFLQIHWIKTITGNGLITSRPPYGRKTIEFQPSFVPFVSCNVVPSLKRVDDAVTRRLELLEFPYCFKDKHDPNYDSTNTLHKERDESLQGLFESKEYGAQFLLILLNTIKRQGNAPLVPTENHKAATLRYFVEQDHICRFIKDTYEFTGDKKDKVQATKLHECVQSTGEKVSAKVIRVKIEQIAKNLQKSVEKKASNGSDYYFGIKLKYVVERENYF